ncbi:MAG: phosphatidate cytidylyltransferase [Rhodopila sp.]|nr:phosphatidate cytidylyltransferase [Rhodopila sp.]
MRIPSVPTAESRKSARWGDLRLRVLSAAVLAPLALGCIWLGGVAFAGLVALITVGLAFEWLGLCGQRESPLAVLLFAALPLAVALTFLGSATGAIGLLAVATVAGTALTRGIGPARPLAFGIPYLGLGAVALVWLRQPPESGGVNVIVLLLVVWGSDIGAYLAGRAIGGPRLAPAISPGKTWSGAVGGLVAAAAVGSASAVILGHGAAVWRPIAFAMLIGCISQAGDLFESLLKRHFGVKDSGALIPGHGGLLDRLDALLAAAPTGALLALVLGRGVFLWE